MQYNIYTEDLKPKTVQKTISKYYEAFTIQKNIGFWNGIKENSILISIVVDTIQDKKIKKLAAELKNILSQEAVLVQRIENNNWLV